LSRSSTCVHRPATTDIYTLSLHDALPISKPGSSEKRPLGIPTVRDRVVQTALRAVLEPIFERIFAAHSYGFRPGRGCKDALRRVDRKSTRLNSSHEWISYAVFCLKKKKQQ